jgi:hypothetical protein
MIGTVRNVGYKFERPSKGLPKPGQPAQMPEPALEQSELSSM